MKKVNVQDAVGMTLCHDITAMFDGFKGALFKRGQVIRAEDIPRLLDIGKKHVFIWEENAGELHEEDCALRLAAMAPVEGAKYDGPSEGKMLLKAEVRGQFRVDTALLRELTVTLLQGFGKKSPVTRLLRGRLELSGGEVCMSLPREQGNVVLSSAVGCDVMAVVPAGSGPLSPGTKLKGFLLE